MTSEQLALFHDCDKRGFAVLDARGYFEQMNPRQPRVCQIIRTPFSYMVNPVIALTATSKKDMNRDPKGYLNTGLVDLFSVATNDQDYLMIDGFEEGVRSGKLTSLSDADPEGVHVLTLGHGAKKIGQRDAYREVQRFASTCAEFPHMRVLNEYLEEFGLMAGMIGGKMPTEDQYWLEYVPDVIDKLVKSEISPMTGEKYRMVGRVTTAKEARAWMRTGPYPYGKEA